MAGLRVQEGSTLNILNCEVVGCRHSCLEADTSSHINIRGSYLRHSGQPAADDNTPPGTRQPAGRPSAGLVLRGHSKANVAKSLWQDHATAVAAYHSDLVFEANSILDTGERAEQQAGEHVNFSVENFSSTLR